MATQKASKLFEVPHTTLQILARSETPIDDVLNIKLGRPHFQHENR
jgi:hypothetical protein